MNMKTISEEGRAEEQRLWQLLDRAIIVDSIDDVQNLLSECERHQASTTSAGEAGQAAFPISNHTRDVCDSHKRLAKCSVQQ